MGAAGPNHRGSRDGDGKRPAKGPGGKAPAPKASAGGRGVRKTSDMDRPTPNARPSPSGANPSDGRGNNAHSPLAFTIPSDFTAGREVQRQVMAVVARNGFNDDSTFAVRIALEEALVNAIKHGNRQHPDKKVRVEATVTPERAEISVEDEGPGFDRARVPDPTCEDNICRPSGRGILLIESYMDGVHWSHGGRRLKMVKENQG